MIIVVILSVFMSQVGGGHVSTCTELQGKNLWEGMDDLVGSTPTFKDNTKDRVSLIVWGGCAEEVIIQMRWTAVFLFQLQFLGV